MAEASRRAAARPQRGGLPNILFLAEGVERLPAAFDDLADRVTVLFPWGSLLRGALGLDPAISAAIARLVRPGGSVEMVLSIAERDRATVGGSGPFCRADLELMTRTFAALGLVAGEPCLLTPAEIGATDSSWARRLGTDPDRPVWRVELRAPAST